MLYTHAPLRANRTQYALAYQDPFTVAALDVHSFLRALLEEYLGPDFLLDLPTVVVASAGAESQEMHRDSRIPGSVAVQVAASSI